VLAEIAVDSPDIIDADRSPAIPSVAKRRERTVEFELPKIESVADVLKTSSAVISACAAGELSPREASEIMELISSRVRDVYLDGIVLKRSWAGEIRNVSLLVAITARVIGRFSASVRVRKKTKRGGAHSSSISRSVVSRVSA
jgi:putative transposase